jgi:hypothetical protein
MGNPKKVSKTRDSSVQGKAHEPASFYIFWSRAFSLAAMRCFWRSGDAQKHAQKYPNANQGNAEALFELGWTHHALSA